MTVVAGDVLRTSISFTLVDGTLLQNVYHHKRTGVAVITDAAHVTALGTWAAAMYGEIVSLVRNNVVANLSSVDKVEWSGLAWEVVENIGSFVPSFTPSGATDALPNQCSPFVIFKTARPKTVGRKFLFPVLENNQDASFIDGAAMVFITAYADEAVNNITLAALNELVPGVPRTGFDVWQEFTLAIVTNVIGTQRRRRPGVGA